jgi:S1-C subfamily serine protease
MSVKSAAGLLILILFLGIVYVTLIVFRRSVFPHLHDLPSRDEWSSRQNILRGGRGHPTALATNPVRLDSVIQQIRPAVVGIRVGSGPTPPAWQAAAPAGQWSVGSGVIVHPRGYIVTNFHVIGAGGPISVSVFTPGGPQEYSAQLIGQDEPNDLALLKISPAQALTAMPIGDSDLVRTGDQMIAIGNPFGLSQSVTRGIVSARRKTLIIGNRSMSNLFQTDVPINPGNSGGALCNLQGELVGINVAIYSPVESVYTGISFAIPINQVKALFGAYMLSAPQPASYGWPAAFPTDVPFTSANPIRIPTAQRIMPSPGEGIEEIAWLGIDLVPEPEGVEVDEIEGITPMEAGLEAGDIIKRVNGYPIQDMYAIKDVIKTIPPDSGESILLDVFRPRNNRNLFIGFKLKRFDVKGR